MRLDVFFTPAQAKPSDTNGRLVVIVDVLRASTTVATALGNGAKTVMPLEGADADGRMPKTSGPLRGLTASRRKRLRSARISAADW